MNDSLANTFIGEEDSYNIKRRATIRTNSFYVGLSKDIILGSGWQIVPYISSGLKFESISKNDFESFYYLTDNYTILQEESLRSFAYSAAYNFGFRFKVPVKVTSSILFEFNWFEGKALKFFDLPYNQERLTMKLTYAKYF